MQEVIEIRNPSLEFQLLLCSARTQLTSEQIEQIHTLTEGAVDWHHLIQMAEFHRIRPLLQESLAAACPCSISMSSPNLPTNSRPAGPIGT